jgi:hypothetical protein
MVQDNITKKQKAKERAKLYKARKKAENPDLFKKKQAEYHKAWYRNKGYLGNPDTYRTLSVEQKQKKKESNRKYEKTHPNRHLQPDKDKVREYNLRYYLKHREDLLRKRKMEYEQKYKRILV